MKFVHKKQQFNENSVPDTLQPIVEEVEKMRTYDPLAVVKILIDNITMSEEEKEDLEHWFVGQNEIEPEQVDHLMLKIAEAFNLSYEDIEILEGLIEKTPNPEVVRELEDKNDLEADINKLNGVLNELWTPRAKEELGKIIEVLNNI